MRVRLAIVVATVLGLVVPASATADCVHVVTPGESLTSIAAADGLSIGQLAAANGLSSAAALLTGSCLSIPPQSGPVLPQSGPTVSSVPTSSGAGGGSYVVQPGDTLTAIAGRAGMSVSQLAAANGINPVAPLDSGTVLQLSGAGQAAAPSPAPSPVLTGDGDGDSDDVGGSAPASSASSASTGGSYVVQPGDTLTAIAGRAGMSVSELASLNGLNAMAPLLSGTVLQLSGGGQAASAPQSQSSGGSGGSYVVQPGDTLSAIAGRAGMSVDQLAALNGLDPLAPLLSGTTLQLSGGGQSNSLPQSSSGSAAASQPVGQAAQGSPVNPPYPTQQTVSPSQVGAIAAANGVPPALAEAIAYQESGFNNAAVSPADARGVMQILPGTWQYIQNTLVNGAPPLAPASATDNIRGGVLLLRSLLNATGGNAADAAAGYYQGLPSVQANGMYSDTQQYVNNVLALEQQFNGGG